MKEITLLSHVFMESTGSTPVDQEAAVSLTKAAHENRKKVIVAGLFVEREIEAIIGFYLYPGPGVSEQQVFVAAEILGSDAVSFSHKKRLILSLVNQKNWLHGEAKGAFDKELAAVIRFRNAFAHGNIIVRDSAAFLEYFEGSKKRVELSDGYWSDLETSFNSLVTRISRHRRPRSEPGFSMRASTPRKCGYQVGKSI